MWRRSLGHGHAFYSSLSFSAGQALGALAAGFLWAAAGGSATFLAAAGIAAAAWLVAATGLRRVQA